MKPTIFAILCLLPCFGLAGCAPKPPPFSGRILFSDDTYDSYCIDGQFNIYELKAGSESPELLWSIPCESGGFAYHSPNSHLLYLESSDLTQSKIVDLLSGEVFPFPATDPQYGSGNPMYGEFAFSPDDRYFAYAEDTYGPGSANLYVFDLQEGRTTLLFSSPCANYAEYLGSQNYTYMCTELGKPAWLDSTNLIINAYMGELPDNAYWGDPIEPNATLVLSLDGQVLQVFQPMLQFQGVYGQTILFYVEGQGTSGYGWMDAVELIGGELDLNPLDTRIDQFPNGYEGDVHHILYQYVASDGLSIFQEDPSFHLLGIRSPSDLAIPHVGISNCNGGIVWSPDMGSVACFDYHNTFVLSLKGYAPLKLPSGSMAPIAWLP